MPLTHSPPQAHLEATYLNECTTVTSIARLSPSTRRTRSCGPQASVMPQGRTGSPSITSLTMSSDSCCCETSDRRRRWWGPTGCASKWSGRAGQWAHP